MSGGSWNYIYCQIEEIASSIYYQQNLPTDLSDLLYQKVNLLSIAMHDIEWVDSCDYSSGKEAAAVKDFLGIELEEYLKKAKTIKTSVIDIDTYLLDDVNRFLNLAIILANQESLLRKAMSFKVKQFAEIMKYYQVENPNFLSEFRIKEIEVFLAISPRC